MDEFRALVEAWLKSTETSQAELGRRAGVSQNIISRWLGRYPTRPSPQNLEKLAPAIGVPYEDLMRMCGYLPGSPRERVDAHRRAIRAELDRWLTAVGPEYEQEFWRSLKPGAESNIRLFQRLKIAVSTPDDTAVSDAVSSPPPPLRGRRNRSGGPLSRSQHPLSEAA
jgi:transcriptional regulator with XRE-family HTH domain